MNVGGVLLFSLAFTNDRLTALSPVVFSRFGLVAIMLWGLAYAAVATSWKQVPWLVAVFALEKTVYVVTWVEWMARYGRDLGSFFAASPFTTVFYVIYGPNDLLFGLFFAWTAARAFRERSLPAPGASGS